MNKKIGVISVLIICLTFVSYIYLRKDTKREESQDVYLKTVVFKDSDNELIPISINFHSQVELEEEVRNCIDFMKSEELIAYGLYPVLSKDLEVESIQVKNKILTINFNDQLYSNQDALDIIEALTFTMTDNQDIQQLKLQIQGKDVSYFT